MERKKYAQICGVCGKQETTGLTTHAQRRHNEVRKELIVGEVPAEPWCADWFERLNKEMQPSQSSNNDAAHIQEIEHLKYENELLRASLSASTRSQSANSKLTNDSLGSAASADGLALRRQHKEKVDSLNKTIGELEDKLKRTKDKYKAQFKEQLNKLEEKLYEQKVEYELKLKQQFDYMDSLRENDLKKAKDKFDLIDLRQEKQISELKEMLKETIQEYKTEIAEFKLKENEWLKMFGQVYNLSKDPSFYKDLKKALEEFQESLNASKANSQHQSPNPSVDNNYITEQMSVTKENEISIDFHCDLCNSDFISTGHKYQHWQNCSGLETSVEYVRQQLKKYANEADEREAKLIQTTLKFDGTLLQKLASYVKLTKAEELEKKARQFFGKDYDWHMRFYDELRRPNYFNLLVQDLIVGPVGDAEGNSMFAQNTTRENLISILGKNKKSRKNNTSLEKEVVTLMKQQAGVPLTLDERR